MVTGEGRRAAQARCAVAGLCPNLWGGPPTSACEVRGRKGSVIFQGFRGLGVVPHVL